MKGKAIVYSADELVWLENNRLLPIAEYHSGFIASFGRQDLAIMHLHSLRKRKGWKTGRTGQFVKGEAPLNKGKRYEPGVGGRHPNAQRTYFQPGVRQGVAKRLYKEIGTERVSKDGYLERKINDDLPLQARWRAVHLINWEAVHGPVGSDNALKCIDGNRLNVATENWVLVSRSMLPRLNGGRYKTTLPFDQAAPELRTAILAVAQVEDAVRRRRKRGINSTGDFA